MHHEIAEKLSEYLDDDFTPQERRVVEAHLRECDDCAATLADLRRVVGTAASLHDVPPAEDLWPGVAQRIKAGSRPLASTATRRFAFSLPQLAAASVLLAVLSGWLAVRVLSPAAEAPGRTGSATSSSSAGGAPIVPVAFNDEQYDAAIRELQQTVERGRSRLDPETIATVERNLRVIDEAVEEARRALAADPASEYLNGYVIETRQRKLELLRHVAALTQTDAM
jgi:hypothetical protein